MPLAAMLIPLLPGLVNGIMTVVDTIRNHADTPEALKTQLDGISSDLKALTIKVLSVDLPAKQ
jgi:hypothetical protein